MAGYSGTPLVQKLGIKSGHRVALVQAPAGFERQLEGLPDSVSLARQVRGTLDVILLFVDRAADLSSRFGPVAKHLDPAGGLWVAWPKKASGRATDLTEGAVRTVGLAAGLVDNKVCAVDEIWSGLRFVVRLADRPHPSAPSAKPSRTRAPRGAKAR